MTTADSHHSDTATGAASHRPFYDDVDNTTILMVGICSAIITVIIVAVAQGLAYRWEHSMFGDRLQSSTYEAINQAIEAQKSNIEIADGEGRMTISEAMAKVVQEYGRGRSTEREHHPSPADAPHKTP